MSVLLTPRLVLNELALDDASDLFAVRGDPEAMTYWDWPADSDRSVTRTLVVGMRQEASDGRAKYWTLRLRSDRTFVGLCDLSELRPEDSADLGFMLVRRHWGQGLALEAVMAVLSYAPTRSQVCARSSSRRERKVSAALGADRVRGDAAGFTCRDSAWRVSRLSRLYESVVTSGRLTEWIDGTVRTLPAK